MSQNTNTNFANRFASKKLFATVLAATFLLGFGITVSVSFAGFNPETDGGMTLEYTAAAAVRQGSLNECNTVQTGEICKEICLNTAQGQVIGTGDFQCAAPGQTTPN